MNFDAMSANERKLEIAARLAAGLLSSTDGPSLAPDFVAKRSWEIAEKLEAKFLPTSKA